LPAGSRLGAAVAALALGGCATPGLTSLEADLAARPSATAVLQSRCASPIRAERLHGQPMPIPLPGIPGATGYRHVRLMCGESVLSEAFNWYAPALLAPAMNAALDTTDRPFGAVAASLGFTRMRLASRRGIQAPCPAGTVLSQRGALRLPVGAPLALLGECYTRAASIARAAE
jgi:hypothetical protein